MKKKILRISVFILAVFTLASCSEDNNDNNVNTPGTPDASFEGTWEAEDIQLLSAPSVNPGIWKPLLVAWGNVPVSTVGKLDITFRADSTWIASGFLTDAGIKSMVKDYQAGTSYSANGRYVKQGNTFNVVMNNYTGRGPTTGTTFCDYSISGDKLTATMNLPNNERWRVVFKKQ